MFFLIIELDVNHINFGRRIACVFLYRDNFNCKTNLISLKYILSYSVITLFNAQSYPIFHQCPSVSVQQRAHTRELTSHNRGRRHWHTTSAAESARISKSKLHQTVSAATGAVRLMSLHLHNLPCWDTTHECITAQHCAAAWPQDVIWVRCHENCGADPYQTGLSWWWKPGHQAPLGEQICH